MDIVKDEICNTKFRTPTLEKNMSKYHENNLRSFENLWAPWMKGIHG